MKLFKMSPKKIPLENLFKNIKPEELLKTPK